MGARRRLILVPADPPRPNPEGRAALHPAHTDHDGTFHAAHQDLSGGGPRVSRVTRLPGGASIVVTRPVSYGGQRIAYAELRTPGRKGATDRIAVRGAGRADLARAVDRLKGLATGGQRYPLRNPDEDEPAEKKPGKRPSKAEAKKLAARYDQLTLTETGDPKKDYRKVPLFQMNPERRRNLDAFTDSQGIVHPIRGTEGYSGVLLRRREKEREREGLTSADQQVRDFAERYEARLRGSTVKAERLAEKLYQLQAERDDLKATLDADPAADLTDLVGERGRARAERGLIPFGEVRKLGIRPEKYRTAVVTQGPHKYLKWEYFLDDLAPERGYGGAEDLLQGIRDATRQKKRLAQLEEEIADARRDAEAAKPRRNPTRRAPGLLERFLAWLSR